MTVLEQVSLGFDQAKKTIYDYAKKYYAKIETSRSTLVNAIFSGISYIYSMFQVFVKLIQDELYVSTATEIESLYKLIPFVGMDLSQPITMKIFTAAVPEAPEISTVEIIYLTGADAWTDSNGYKFYLRTQSNVKQKAWDFDAERSWSMVAIQGEATPTRSGRFIELSLGKLLGADFVPISVYNSDVLVLELPYVKGGTLEKAVLLCNGVTIDASQSTVPGDIDTVNCSFYNETGYVRVYFTTDVYADITALRGNFINMSSTGRSVYRRNYMQLNKATTDYKVFNNGSAYYRSNVYVNTANSVAEGAVIVITAVSYLTTEVLNLSDSSSFELIGLRSGVAPLSIKLNKGSIQYDFSSAVVLNDLFWGTIYRTIYTNDAGTKFYAYLLDEFLGLVFFEDPDGGTINLNNWTVDYTENFGSKVLLEQFEKKTQTIDPAVSLNFDAMTFDMEDTDPILFEQVGITINDATFSTIAFEQVANIDTVEGTASKAYFEVQPLSPTKIRIRFGDLTATSYSNIQSLTIAYDVVKQLNEYASGTQITGSTTAGNKDGSQYVGPSAQRLFTFTGLNLTAQAGVGGLPDIESLRSALEKSAYTFDRYITRINYEAAIQAWFISQGWEAQIKVFDYIDFGLAYLDSTNGNIVFFMGLKNKFVNQNPVLVVPTELTAAQIGNDSSAAYTREELGGTIALPGGQVILASTDIGKNVVNAVGEDGSEADDIRIALAPKTAMTNYLLADPTFVRMYAVYFKVLIRPKAQYTFSDADVAVRRALASMFTWQQMAFVRDINVSDTYRILDSLPEVDKVLLQNMSHIRNDALPTLFKVRDIAYRTLVSPVVASISIAGSMSAKYSADTSLINIGVDAAAAGIRNGSFITISGFTNGANNGVDKLVTAIQDGAVPGDRKVIQVAGMVFATETHAAIITANKVIRATVVAAGNKIQVMQIIGSMIANPAANPLKIDIGTDPGFQIGDKISITGFVTAANNVVGKIITGIAGTVLTLETGVAFVNETHSATVFYMDSFATIGLTTQRRINIIGFISNGTLTNVLLTSVTNDRIVLSTAEKTLVNEVMRPIRFSVGDDRIDNPLWDFTQAVSGRTIGIDVLGVGGIATEIY